MNWPMCFRDPPVSAVPVLELYMFSAMPSMFYVGTRVLSVWSFFLFILCVWCFVCMQFLWRLEEVIRSSGTGVTRDSCETPCGYSVRAVHCSHWPVNWNTAVSQWQVLFPVYDLIFQNTDNFKCTQNSVCIHFIQSNSETMHIFTKGSMVFSEVCYLFFFFFFEYWPGHCPRHFSSSVSPEMRLEVCSSWA